MFIYENHKGGLFALDTMLDYEEAYCDECGDVDWLLCEAQNRREAEKFLFNECGDEYEGLYIRHFIDSIF